jgi:putative (di)nucleoside polyphosphate hydrolase
MQLKIRQAVGAFISNKKGEFLLVKKRRRSMRNVYVDEYWDIPKGGVKGNENLLTALKRELREELGTRKFRNITRLKLDFYYDFPKKWRQALNARGQHVELFYAEFYGKKGDIKVDGHELDDFVFLPPKKFLRKVAFVTTRKAFRKMMKMAKTSGK